MRRQIPRRSARGLDMSCDVFPVDLVTPVHLRLITPKKGPHRKRPVLRPRQLLRLLFDPATALRVQRFRMMHTYLRVPTGYTSSGSKRLDG